MKTNYAWHEELVQLLLLAAQDQDKDLLDAVLRDLCTPAELQTMARRWQIIKLLYAETPQHNIAKRVGVAIATVTRGSRALQKPTSGFARLIHMILTTKRPNRAVKAWRDQLMSHLVP